MNRQVRVAESSNLAELPIANVNWQELLCRVLYVLLEITVIK